VWANERIAYSGFRLVRTLDVQPAKSKKPALAAAKDVVKFKFNGNR